MAAAPCSVGSRRAGSCCKMKSGGACSAASAAWTAGVVAGLSSIYRLGGIADNVDTSNPLNNLPLYRFYNMKTGTHFYTISEVEKATLTAPALSATWRFEGTAYFVSGSSVDAAPVYRFFRPKSGTHFYTASETEKNTVIATLSSVYRFEGVAFYLAGAPGAPVTPVEMPWHQSTNVFCTQSGCHFKSLTVEHYRYPIGSATKLTCATCSFSSTAIDSMSRSAARSASLSSRTAMNC